jgi:hypothetical protein
MQMPNDKILASIIDKIEQAILQAEDIYDDYTDDGVETVFAAVDTLCVAHVKLCGLETPERQAVRRQAEQSECFFVVATNPRGVSE